MGFLLNEKKTQENLTSFYLLIDVLKWYEFVLSNSYTNSLLRHNMANFIGKTDTQPDLFVV